MRHYSTLFDSAYLAKGLAMYESLRRHSIEDFVLHVIAMDEETAAVLAELDRPCLRVYQLSAFESDMGLAPVRGSRSWQEYCWTCASLSMAYLFRWIAPEMLTYLDADLFFFSDPQVVFDEIDNRSIAITPHRFPSDRLHMERNGKFNVGWVTFRNDEAGRLCAERWADQCREWCFARNEEGKFGDQGYLDRWPELFAAKLAIINDIGVNAAPWNLGQYSVRAGARIGDAPTLNDQQLVCYHFHEYEHATRLTNYSLTPEAVELIYRPYIRAYVETESSIDGARSRIREKQEHMQRQAETV